MCLGIRLCDLVELWVFFPMIVKKTKDCHLCVCFTTDSVSVPFVQSLIMVLMQEWFLMCILLS